ncbi:MAG: alpha/beta hydrolase family protein [Actinomycetota bacterium]|nr:alpha/beta hydrolase family protein [Actinomycetota bacterium]
MALPPEDVGDPFALFPASPASIEGVAGDIAARAVGFESLQGQVATGHGVAVAATAGDLAAPMGTAVQPALEGLQSLAGASSFGAAAVRRWADHVVAYDNGVGQLNQRWRTAAGSDFGAGPAGDGPDAVAAARSSLLAELRAEHARLEGTLDTGATQVAGLLDTGPTAQTLAYLFSSGDLPASDFLNGPQLTTGIESTIARLITAGVLPPQAASMSPDELAEYLAENPEVAQQLMEQSPQQGTPGSPEHELALLLLPAYNNPGEAAAYEQQRQQDIRDLFTGLDPDDAAILSMLFPTAVGNTAGVPFTNRAQANNTAVIAALADERDNLADLEEQDAENKGNNGWFGWNSWDDNDLDGPIADAQSRIELYESIIADDRQILFFDPSGDGAIAELHGTIDASTDNVGVLVPGTGSDLANIQGTMDNAQSFVDNDPMGSLAMITWMGGDLPDSVWQDAPYNHYADDLAPSLVGFSQQLGDEIDANAHPGTQVTVAGHSYGGAAVGVAETYGLEADRVLHISSAGMGSDVLDAGDLPASQAEVDRYSMTAPGDPIENTQGVNDPLWIDRAGHGADPDTFPGTVRLETGYYADGEWIEGSDAHGGVLQLYSDAWENMYEVFTGGEVVLYAPPEITTYPNGQGPPVVIVEPNTDPPETLDIP